MGYLQTVHHLFRGVLASLWSKRWVLLPLIIGDLLLSNFLACRAFAGTSNGLEHPWCVDLFNAPARVYAMDIWEVVCIFYILKVSERRRPIHLRLVLSVVGYLAYKQALHFMMPNLLPPSVPMTFESTKSWLSDGTIYVVTVWSVVCLLEFIRILWLWTFSRCFHSSRTPFFGREFRLFFAASVALWSAILFVQFCVLLPVAVATKIAHTDGFVRGLNGLLQRDDIQLLLSLSLGFGSVMVRATQIKLSAIVLETDTTEAS